MQEDSFANLCNIYLVAKCHPLQAQVQLSLLTEQSTQS